MKTTLITTIMIVTLVGCNKEETPQLTPHQQKLQQLQEIKERERKENTIRFRSMNEQRAVDTWKEQERTRLIVKQELLLQKGQHNWTVNDHYEYGSYQSQIHSLDMK